MLVVRSPSEYCPVRQLELWRKTTSPGAKSAVFRIIEKDNDEKETERLSLVG